MSDLTQQALAALADAWLGNESAAEAFVVGYQAGWDKAFNLAIRIENELNADEPPQTRRSRPAPEGSSRAHPAPPTGTPSAKSLNRHGCTRPKRRSQPSTP